MLKCRETINIYLLILCFCFSFAGHATELKLDEHMPVSELSKQVVLKDVMTSKVENPISLPMASDGQSIFQSWWLLFIYALFLLIGWGLMYWQGCKKDEAKEPVEAQLTSLEDIESAALRAAEIRKTVKASQPKSKLSSKRYVSNPEPAALFKHEDLKKAYKYHKLGRQQQVLEIMNLAFRYDPFDYSVYDVSIRMLADSEEAFPELQRLLKTGLFLLRTKRPMIWKEVAIKGKDLLPELEDWSWKPE